MIYFNFSYIKNHLQLSAVLQELIFLLLTKAGFYRYKQATSRSVQDKKIVPSRLWGTSDYSICM